MSNLIENENKSEKYIEYGNEKLTKEFLEARITELDNSLKDDKAFDIVITEKNLELNYKLFQSYFAH